MNFTILNNTADDHTYFCLYCELQAQKAEIENLMETITQLQISLSELKRKLDSSQQIQLMSKSSVSIPSDTTTTTTVLNSAKSGLNQTNAEKQFNVVVYGISESPKNTNHQLRIKKDMENIIEALSKTENEVRPSDIKDLYISSHQILYNPANKCPRPLLVKLLHSNMAFDILSSKTKLETPKPDMTHQEHQKE